MTLFGLRNVAKITPKYEAKLLLRSKRPRTRLNGVERLRCYNGNCRNVASFDLDTYCSFLVCTECLEKCCRYFVGCAGIFGRFRGKLIPKEQIPVAAYFKFQKEVMNKERAK